MKKDQKTPVINNQEDEDFEVYTLYPENATVHTIQEMPNKKHNPSFSIKTTAKILQFSNTNPSASE